MEDLFETLDTEQQLRISKQVINELKQENEMLLNALKKVNKAIDNMKLNDRFGHTQQYVREAIKKAEM
tara:strand:+ start:272 stop:475 length:204 start_codon:yes stop_codon:yes gene_type:complete